MQPDGKSTMTSEDIPAIGVLSGDPTLPYEHGADSRFSDEDQAAVQRFLETLGNMGGYWAVAGSP